MIRKIRKNLYRILFIAFAVGFLAGWLYIPKDEGRAYFDAILSKIPFVGRFTTPPSELESYELDGKTKAPTVSSKAYMVADIESGVILKEKAKDKAYPIASVTKFMTALVALENIPQDEFATVSETALTAYGREGDLRLGEKIRVRNLLYPLLLESSNDAAEVLAEHLGRPAFLDLMNNKAKALGMTATKFKDPSGLSEKNVSSPSDLVKLAMHLSEERKEILAITKARSFSVKKSDVERAHTWYNHNRFVLAGRASFLGGKNGYTPEAEQTGLTIFELPVKDGSKKGAKRTRTVAVVVLRSTERYRDLGALASFVETGVLYSKVPSKQASLLFVGDIMMDRGVRKYVEKNAGGDFSSLFKNTFFVKNATVAFANLEGPVSDKGYDLRNLYSFRMPPASLDALAAAGFDAVSVANNHVGDWGRTAFEDTLTNIESRGLLAVGGGSDGVNARAVKIREANGLKIGYLGFSDVGPKWLATNDSLPVILTPDIKDFDEVIRKASKEVDHLVVSFHFGNEYEAKSSYRQQSLAKRAIDAGARIVVGSHPHVIQEVERYNGGVIAYSLGNFIFDQTFSEETREGMALEVLVNEQGVTEVNQGLVRINDAFQPTLVEGRDL